MEYVYAAAILHELDQEINEPNMKAVLESAGADVSESRVKAIIAALEGVDLDQIVGAAQPALHGDEPAAGEMESAETDDGTEAAAEGESDLPEPTDEEAEGDDSGSLTNLFGGDSE